MDKRIKKPKNWRTIQKLISDFPQALDDYQEIITKTKDKTIYELKSSLEEKELTIRKFKKIKRKVMTKKIERAASITKLFLNKENKSLLDFFLEKLHTDKDLIISTILENDDFNSVIKTLGYNLNVVENIDARAIFGNDEYFNENRIKL